MSDVGAGMVAAENLFGKGEAFRGYEVVRRLGMGVTSHHTEDDVVEWLNRIFK